MENQDQLPKEEVVNPEQEREGQEDQDDRVDTQEAGYTPGETEFADGEGTRLDQESEELEIDQETDDIDNSQTNPESDEEDADFENPEDDPA